MTTQQRSGPAQSSATAIDIALEPDQAMLERAGAVNARLRGVYPAGFALDAVHHPHVTMLQQFVGTADLEGVFAAADEVFAGVQLATWQLRAFRYYYIPSPPIGLAGIVIEPTDDLLALQRNLIDAIAPYAVQTGTAAAFASADEGRDIQESLIEYVATFVGEATGQKFNPHVTVGAATAEYLDQMLAEPFEAFSFSPIGASIYQLGTFGTAQRQLTRLPLTRRGCLPECHPHRLPVCLPPTGRPLNIGEQKRDNVRRRNPRGHPHRMSHRRSKYALVGLGH